MGKSDHKISNTWKNKMMQVVCSMRRLQWREVLTKKAMFTLYRDPSLSHPECKDHLQQPEWLWRGDGCPHWQWSWGRRGRTEGQPEDGHSIPRQWLLQCLQLQLHQWEHTPTHVFVVFIFHIALAIKLCLCKYHNLASYRKEKCWYHPSLTQNCGNTLAAGKCPDAARFRFFLSFSLLHCFSCLSPLVLSPPPLDNLPASCPLPSPCVLQCHVEQEKFPRVCLKPHLVTPCWEANRETVWGRRRRICSSLPYSRVCWRLAPNMIRWADCDPPEGLCSFLKWNKHQSDILKQDLV